MVWFPLIAILQGKIDFVYNFQLYDCRDNSSDRMEEVFYKPYDLYDCRDNSGERIEELLFSYRLFDTRDNSEERIEELLFSYNIFDTRDNSAERTEELLFSYNIFDTRDNSAERIEELFFSYNIFDTRDNSGDRTTGCSVNVFPNPYTVYTLATNFADDPNGNITPFSVLQGFYDAQPGLDAPDLVPQEIYDLAYGVPGHIIYVGHNQSYYKTTSNGAWTAFIPPYDTWTGSVIAFVYTYK